MMRAGIRVDGRGRNVGIPQAAAGERNKTVETRGLTSRHDVAGEVAAAGAAATVAAIISGGMRYAGTGRQQSQRQECGEKSTSFEAERFQARFQAERGAAHRRTIVRDAEARRIEAFGTCPDSKVCGFSQCPAEPHSVPSVVRSFDRTVRGVKASADAESSLRPKITLLSEPSWPRPCCRTCRRPARRQRVRPRRCSLAASRAASKS